MVYRCGLREYEILEYVMRQLCNVGKMLIESSPLRERVPKLVNVSCYLEPLAEEVTKTMPRLWRSKIATEKALFKARHFIE